jgi:arsenite-transporting ATPase
VARFTFFVGKGGVGKTTVSSAYALHQAAKRPRRPVLLLSTDPAHSLADILQTKLGDVPKRLPVTGRLWVRQLDAEKQINSFLKTEREEILALLNRGSLFTGDELASLLDTSLPGMAEVAALLAIHELLDSKFDEIVVDTAPMGHAIRLFQMPQHFARFLDVLEAAASRDVVLARHFGGRVLREPAVERWSRMVDRVEGALSMEGSKLVLVTTPELFSLNQAARSVSLFQDAKPQNRFAGIVLNRAVANQTNCPRCQRRWKQGESARKFIQKHFRDTELFSGDDPGCPILGVEALRRFGAHVFDGKRLLSSIRSKPAKPGRFRLEPAEWPPLISPLTLTLGKGGVGKTTISAALAYHHCKFAASESVSICSIDPAPSLDDVFAAEVGSTLCPVLGDRKLRAAEFDAIAEFQQWAGQLRTKLDQAMTGEERGIHVDLSLDRKFLLALLEVVPPGVDEIFATFGILDLLKEDGRERVVIDMAPTAHALEVLRTPDRLLAWARVLLKTLAAHRTLPLARDAGVEVAKLSQRVRELSSILRDRKRCQIVIVTLAELLPDHETRRLLEALRELRAPLGAVFVNRVLMDGKGCRRCTLVREWQAASLASLRKQSGEIYVAPEFETAIAGATALDKFTRRIWRPA